MPAAHVEGSLTVNLGGALVPDTANPTWVAVRDTFALAVSFPWTANGGAAGSAEQVYHGTLSAGAGSFVDLDLASSTENAFGDALAFTGVKAIMVRNTHATLPLVVTTSGPATPWTGAFAAAASVTVQAGGLLVLASPTAAGYTVTAGASDTLRFTNAGGSAIDVDVIVVGIV